MDACKPLQRSTPAFLCFLAVRNNVDVVCCGEAFTRVADLDEVWTLLGVSGCPQCLSPNSQFAELDAEFPARSFEGMRRVIQTARRMLLDRGRVTEVQQLLSKNRLSLLHTKMWNPFLALPHADVNCFPADRLHELCVRLTLSCKLLCLLHLAFILTCASLIFALSDLGVIKLCVDAMQYAIKSQHTIGAVAARLLHKLSLRVQNLTRLLPGNLPVVYGLFQETGPSVQGSHYRYMGKGLLGSEFDCIPQILWSKLLACFAALPCGCWTSRWPTWIRSFATSQPRFRSGTHWFGSDTMSPQIKSPSVLHGETLSKRCNRSSSLGFRWEPQSSTALPTPGR